VSRPRIVVLGDVILDRDLLGRTERIAPDAPVPVLDVEQVRESPGGAGLTALLCAAPDVDVLLIAPIGEDPAGARLSAHLRARIDLLPLPQQGSTRTKTRVRSAGQSLLRLDEGGPGNPVRPPLEPVRQALAEADVVLVSDYGAGTTTDPGLRGLLAACAASTPVVWDPHPRGGPPVAGTALVTPNLAEARAAVPAGGPAASTRPADALAIELREHWASRAVCVTAGSAGAFLATPGSEPLFVPAPLVEAGDPCGAGDRFAASAALALAAGALPSEAVTAAVQAASAWVAAGGAAAFRENGRHQDRHPARATPVARARARAGDEGPVTDEIRQLLAAVRSRGGQVVATGGCFDILHVGHIVGLEAARRAGDALIVLLNSDESVRRLKGPARPVVTAAERARVLQALESVDAVIIFAEDDPRAVLDQLRPDIWAKGADYGGTALPEAELVRSWGGRVLLLPYVDGRSSSSVLERLAVPHQFEADPFEPDEFGAADVDPFDTNQEVS
jgi:D-beta-D-heptose 7-phosphate kinase/D-beta-D-heptose 1-phosphate adenosyltransferase